MNSNKGKIIKLQKNKFKITIAHQNGGKNTSAPNNFDNLSHCGQFEKIDPVTTFIQCKDV